MKVTGTILVQQSPSELWSLLLDPEVLRHCVPGCEEIEREADDLYRVKLKVGFGLVRGRFKGHVRIVDPVEEERYTIQVNARGTTGFVEGKTSIVLNTLDSRQRTELAYEGEAHIGGALASVGSRLFQGAIRSFQKEFFKRLAAL